MTRFSVFAIALVVSATASAASLPGGRVNCSFQVPDDGTISLSLDLRGPKAQIVEKDETVGTPIVQNAKYSASYAKSYSSNESGVFDDSTTTEVVYYIVGKPDLRLDVTTFSSGAGANKVISARLLDRTNPGFNPSFDCR